MRDHAARVGAAWMGERSSSKLRIRLKGSGYGKRPDIGVTDGMEVKKGNHEPRFCKTCEHYKPPRSECARSSGRLSC